jgi:hypothetical protein
VNADLDADPFRIQRVHERRIIRREWRRACVELGLDPDDDSRWGFPDFVAPIRERMRRNNPGRGW